MLPKLQLNKLPVLIVALSLLFIGVLLFAKVNINSKENELFTLTKETSKKYLSLPNL